MSRPGEDLVLPQRGHMTLRVPLKGKSAGADQRDRNWHDHLHPQEDGRAAHKGKKDRDPPTRRVLSLLGRPIPGARKRSERGNFFVVRREEDASSS